MTVQTSAWDALLMSGITVPGAPVRSIDDGPLPPFDWRAWSTPTWIAERAFARLGVTLLPFPEQWQDQLAGFAIASGVGLNQRARFKPMIAAHEFAHILLRHTRPQTAAASRARQPIEEFEAESVAMLVAHALDLGDAAIASCRFYIQCHLDQPCAGELPRSWDRIKQIALDILRAGVRPAKPYTPRAVASASSFATAIRWHS